MVRKIGYKLLFVPGYVINKPADCGRHVICGYHVFSQKIKRTHKCFIGNYLLKYKEKKEKSEEEKRTRLKPLTGNGFCTNPTKNEEISK